MSFEVLQRERLVEAWRADLPGSTTPHVVVGLPSYSLDRSVYEHYGDRVPPLENRYLYALLRASDPATRVIYLSSLPVHPEIMEGYLELIEAGLRPAVLERGLVVTPDDLSRRSLAEKLLDRGDLIDEVRRFIGGQPALIEAWNVTEAEAALAVALGAPINGSHPGHGRLATKSNGRRLLREAGVPVPQGVEDVRSPREVVAAIATLKARQPGLRAVVIKLDDSVAGDGNIVVDVPSLPCDVGGGSCARAAEAAVVRLLPDWYQASLKAGGIVEERIEGDALRSPSVQAEITPMGVVVVLATHEQRLGGPNHQVYEGCSFPADPAYAPLLGAYAEQVGGLLAEAGAIGRFGVDFVTSRHPSSGDWQVFGLEINLRKGGTTHTLGISRLLRGGAYDATAGIFVSARGRSTYYGATDNLVEEAWIGRSPRQVRSVITDAGLAFDRATDTGVVPHLLDCLLVDGRMGYTAIADDPSAVLDLEQRLVAALRT